MKRILLVVVSMILLWSSNANSQWSIQGEACVQGYKVDCSAEFKRHDNHDTVLTNIFKRCVRRQALPRMSQQSRLGAYGASRNEVIRLARTICNESAEVQIQLENTKEALRRLKSCMCRVGCNQLGYLKETISMCGFGAAPSSNAIYYEFMKNEKPLAQMFIAILACKQKKSLGLSTEYGQSKCSELLQTFRLKMVGLTLEKYRELSQDARAAADSKASEIATQWMAKNLDAIKATQSVVLEFDSEKLHQVVTSALIEYLR